MAAREEILSNLRNTLNRADLRFPPANPQPLSAETRMTVGIVDEGEQSLPERFGAELARLHGSYEVVGSATAARLTLINRLVGWMADAEASRKGARFETGQERSVLSWPPAQLPVSGLAESLADMRLQLVVPERLDTAEERDAVKHIRYGLTGVEAAFAATGSMLVVSGPETNRSASLLPLRHIALIPISRLYPTIEDWLAERRRARQLGELLRQNANLTLITGPSKSADIEMNLTLGVHGPKYVHAIIFED